MNSALLASHVLNKLTSQPSSLQHVLQQEQESVEDEFPRQSAVILVDIVSCEQNDCSRPSTISVSETSNTANDVRSEKEEGIVPVILFDDTLNEINEIMFAISEGREPDKSLFASESAVSISNCPNSDGIVPLNIFSSTKNSTISLSSGTTDGIVPVKKFCEP